MCQISEAGSEFLSLLRRRVTAREFSKQPIPKSMVVDLLEAALNAPSEFNLQPWRPVVCYSEESKMKLVDCCFGQKHVAEAGAAVIVAASTAVFHDEAARAVDDFIDKGRWPKEERNTHINFIHSCYGKDQSVLRLHAIKNAMLFGHQLLLAGLSLGLSGFWAGGIDEEKSRGVFGIPSHVVIAGVVGLGWPSGKEEIHQNRLPMDSLVTWK